MNDLSRDLGRHDADIDTLKKDMADVKVTLSRIEATLHETKGGVRTLLAVGGVAGAVGAGIVKFVGTIKGGGA
ncbi:MAG: hypothetical protein ACKO0Z_24540 [Betaproteobacteria bacterium]